MVLVTYQIDVDMNVFKNCLRYREGDFNPSDMETVLALPILQAGQRSHGVQSQRFPQSRIADLVHLVQLCRQAIRFYSG